MTGRRKLPRVVPAAAAVILAAAICAPAQAQKRYPYTHTVTVSGKITNEWTHTALRECDDQGSGSMTITFAWERPQRVLPARLRQHRWMLQVPVNPTTLFSRDLPPQRATGTVTWVDGLAPVGPDCDPPEPSSCRTTTFRERVGISGVNLRSIEFDTGLPDPPGRNCKRGEFRDFGDPPFTPREFLLRMPSPRRLARQRTVVVRRSHTGRLDFSDEDRRIAETVTTEVAVTFRRLRR